MTESGRKEVDRYHLHVGLNNLSNLEQRFDTQRYTSVVDYVCKNNGIPYTLSVMRGGYFHDDGRYTNENSLDIMLMDVPEDTVNVLASELCAMLEQDCVLVVRDRVEIYLLSDSIE